MNFYDSVFEHSLFENIHIEKEGSVIKGINKNVHIFSCFFNNVSTAWGGPCLDLTFSSLVVELSCFSHCKSNLVLNDAFANILKLNGPLLKLSLVSSYLCADSFDSGDSSFYGESNELNMSDSNASSNYSPDGASSLRIRTVDNQKMIYVKRSIDINSAKFTILEAEAETETDVSYCSFLNSTENYCILALSHARLSWCVFREQCSTLCPYVLEYVSNCYSDQLRTELTSTTSIFEIPIFEMGIHYCEENIFTKKCSILNRFSQIIKIITIYSSI